MTIKLNDKRTHKIIIVQSLDGGVYTYHVDIAKYPMERLLALKQSILEELDIRDAETGRRFDEVPLQLPLADTK